MTKRAHQKYKKHTRDYYVSPSWVARPLAPFLERDYVRNFVEPCAGNGALCKALHELGFTLVSAFDIEPMAPGIERVDALRLTKEDFDGADAIITNPPWNRAIMHPLIAHMVQFRPTWLLFDANWPNTQQSAELMRHCSDIVPIGRVSWMHNGKGGFDDAVWGRFQRAETATTLHPISAETAAARREWNRAIREAAA
ncbi:MAG: class I SAM-dependent methyltransferase [Pseudomonadota bacterium]